jgi:hypothetical protein
MEPYLAKVAIDDRPKMEFTTAADGSQYLAQTRAAMYPREYDALGVMQAVKQAVDTQDKTAARQSVDAHGEPVIVTKGEATLIDGVSKMPIRLILNADTGRVKTAFPMISGKNAIMDLTPDEMWRHATGKRHKQFTKTNNKYIIMLHGRDWTGSNSCFRTIYSRSREHRPRRIARGGRFCPERMERWTPWADYLLS